MASPLPEMLRGWQDGRGHPPETASGSLDIAPLSFMLNLARLLSVQHRNEQIKDYLFILTNQKKRKNSVEFFVENIQRQKTQDIHIYLEYLLCKDDVGKKIFLLKRKLCRFRKGV